MASTAPSVTAIPIPSPSLPPNQAAGASLPPLSATPSSVATITPPVGAQGRDSSDVNGHTYAPPTSASPQLNNGTPIDARVRNPVPSKLKGRIDGRNGNFSVMHMDLVRPDMTERDLAAKRSSEGTEAAARLANREGYRPVKRTRWFPPDSHLYPSHPTLPPGLSRHPNALVPSPGIPYSVSPSITPSAAPSAATSATSIALSTTSQSIPMTTPSTPISVPAVNSALPPSNTTPITNSPHNPTLSNPTTDIETATSISHPRTQLTPAETKVEQARLLALLPSLNPTQVVEQVCEALRHFGGAPGAPAPHDGVFPESAFNGSGSLFVSWVAEIFSQVGPSATNSQDKTPVATIGGISSATSSNTLSVPVKRGRGRPKGSTKKSKEAKYAGATAPGINPTDGSTMPQAMPMGAMVDASQLSMDDANGTHPHFPTSTLMEQNSDGSAMTTPGLRKRGRPKGSKNKPKSKPTDDDGASDQVHAGAPHQSQCSMMDSPLAHKTSGQAGSYYATNEASVEPNLHLAAPHIMQDYSGHAQSRAHTNGLAQGVQLPSPGNQNNNNVTPRASTWKRKNSRHSQLGNQDTPETSDMLHSPSSTQNHTPTSQIQQQVKRRRVSREANQNLGPGGMDSQLSGPEILASPLIGTDGQPLSPVKQLRHGIGLIIQEEIHKQQHHQPSGMEQQPPNPAHGPSPGMQRNQSSHGQGPPQTTMSAPTYFQPQRQVPNQYGHSENPGDRFGRNMGPNQFQQHMMNSSPSLGSQPPPPSQQQPQPGRPPHPIGPFQGYTDQPYLDMDYSGTPASFGGHAQLEAALAEPTVGDRMFHTMGRR